MRAHDLETLSPGAFSLFLADTSGKELADILIQIHIFARSGNSADTPIVVSRDTIVRVIQTCNRPADKDRLMADHQAVQKCLRCKSGGVIL